MTAPLVSLLFFLFPQSSIARTPRIAVVADGPSDTYRDTMRILAPEIDALLTQSHPGFACPVAPTHVADYSAAAAEARLQEALADRSIDLVIGFGVRTGQAVAKIRRLSKPIILPFAAPSLQGLPQQGDRSGRKNLAYLGGLVDLEREIRRFREVIRKEYVVFLIDKHYLDAIDGLAGLIEQRVTGAAGLADQPVIASVDGGAQAALTAIPPKAEAVYIGSLLRLPHAEIQTLIDGINARRLPSYASGGRRWVEKGAFTSFEPADDILRRMRQVALYVADALRGEDPGNFSIAFEPRSALVINMATARKIGVWPRFDIMTEAELLGQDPTAGRGRRLSLEVAATEAVAANLDLTAARLDRNVAQQQLRQTQGALGPSVNADGTFTWLDPDVSTPLSNAERTLEWGLSGQQLVYSPITYANIWSLDANRDSVDARVRGQELDIILNVAVAYLDVLRARTAERINRENLRRTRRNLALAELRVDVGQAGREEVFRLQTEIADGRAAVIAASATRNQAEIAVNVLLNRPPEEAFRPEEPDDPARQEVVHPSVLRMLEDPWSFRVFRAFMVTEAIKQVPELQELDRAIDAQSHVLTGLRRRLFIPDAFLTGGFTHTLDRSGAGSVETENSIRDDFIWQFGAALQFNVFDLTRYAEIEEANVRVTQLETQRRSVALKVEQQVRSTLHQAGASRAAVTLRQDAAAAARENFALVTDKYRRGAVNVVTLLDAQNQALVTELNAANATYDFLIDALNVQRAVGRFSFRSTKQEEQAFVERLERFAAENKYLRNGSQQ